MEFGCGCNRWNGCLGLGDIGPEAGMPVMEGKSVLFKAFGDVNGSRFVWLPKM